MMKKGAIMLFLHLQGVLFDGFFVSLQAIFQNKTYRI